MARPAPPLRSVRPPSYYNQLATTTLFQKVQDFDDPSVFAECERRAADERSLNFVLDFGYDEAWSMFDVGDCELRSLLAVSAERPSAFDTRWINIWAPHRQQALVQEITSRYKLSPRLAALMLSSPRWDHVEQHPRRSSAQNYHSPTNSNSKYGARISYETQSVRQANSRRQLEEEEILASLNHYDIVDSIWHWSSVDFGEQYLCVGYNSLLNVGSPEVEEERSKRGSDPDMPHGTRVWTWLILCADKTIITLVEGTAPRSKDIIDVTHKRRNLLNVFRQISRASHTENLNAISLVPIRFSVNPLTMERRRGDVDTPGLLFYYLFDDWASTYNMIAKRHHQYGARLNKVRKSMMDHAQLGHVDELHHIGRQLAVLKRLYQSYELIIGRVLERQTKGSRGAYSTPTHKEALPLSDVDPVAAYEQFGVHLTSTARYRFERLKDRIQLYVLSEINESQDLRNSLLNMNFNLITIKESNSVEKLTRITILLAKVTILFLPVSLSTAYFSTQLEGVKFSQAAYWATFAVVLAVSFGVLLIFGWLSGTTEGELVYQPMYRVILNVLSAPFGRGPLARGMRERVRELKQARQLEAFGDNRIDMMSMTGRRQQD